MKLVNCKIEEVKHISKTEGDKPTDGYCIRLGEKSYTTISGLTGLIKARGIKELKNWDLSIKKSNTNGVKVIAPTDLSVDGEVPGVIYFADLSDSEIDRWFIMDRFGNELEGRPPFLDIIRSLNNTETSYSNYGEPGKFLLGIHTSRKRNGFACILCAVFGDEVTMYDPFTGNRLDKRPERIRG
jgi:hypothetical protein